MANVAQRFDVEGRTASHTSADELPLQLPLELTVDDSEVIAALCQYEEGAARDDFALAALKIGVTALRHVGQRVDVDLIQRESARMLESLDRQLEQHGREMQQRLTGELKRYFDPQDGHFPQRVERLVREGGELEDLLRRQIGGEDSALAKTLVEHVGENSRLMKWLSPDEGQGVLLSLRQIVERQLQWQRDQLLKQFSLDEEDSALKRLVRELTTSHGKLGDELQAKIDTVMKEFSLDEEDSALKRLVTNVEGAQKRISAEFSLDNENSALRRLKSELTTILEAQVKTSAEFQEEVKVALAKLVATREEAARGTRHGTTFEHAVFQFMQHLSQKAGDAAEDTSSTTGLIKNRKLGDVVIELGPDSAAPGARIVVEAKEDKAYNLAKAREELELARKNRGAQIGLFVFSAKTAPEGIEPLARYGQDIVLVWDAEDANTDVQVIAALSLARALCVRDVRQQQRQTSDLEAIDRAILDVEKRAANLGQITSWAETIRSNSGKIIDRVALDREALERQASILREMIDDLASDSPR